MTSRRRRDGTDGRVGSENEPVDGAGHRREDGQELKRAAEPDLLEALTAALAESSAQRETQVDPSTLPDDVGDLAGVTERRADHLREAGVEIDELRAFRRDRIAEVDGISRGLAGRLKSVVGDRFRERDGVDPRPVLDAVDEETVWVEADALDGDRLEGDVTVEDGYVSVVDADGDRRNVAVGPDRTLFVDATDGVPAPRAVASGRGVELVDATAVDADVDVAVGLAFGEFRRLFDDRIEAIHVAETGLDDGRVRVDGGSGVPAVEAEDDLSPETDHVVSVKYPDGMDVFQTGTERRNVVRPPRDHENVNESDRGPSSERGA